MRRAPAVLAFAFAALVAACQSPPAPGWPEITFAHRTPIRLDVARVEVVQTYRPPQAAPNVEHLFPITPAAVLRRWAKERLKAAGTSRTARVTIVNAAVIETKLPTHKGLQGLFYSDQAQRYDATLEVRIDILDDGGRALGHVRTVAERSRTVTEGISLNERSRVWFELTEAVVRDFDTEMERTIRRYLADFVLPGPTSKWRTDPRVRAARASATGVRWQWAGSAS